MEARQLRLLANPLLSPILPCFTWFILPGLPQAFSPFTLFEAGWNFNYTKAFVRLLRNRGALMALPPQEKADIAVWWVWEGSRGERVRFWDRRGSRLACGTG